MLLNWRPTKSPFNPHYIKSVPNPNNLIISPHNNDKILVLAKMEFLTIFSYLSNGTVTLKWTFKLRYLSNQIFKGGLFWPLMHVVLSDSVYST